MIFRALLLLLLHLICIVNGQSSASDVPVIGAELEPFNVALGELEKDTKEVTTLSEQCKRFVDHYRYYCKRTSIASFNEEVRIICERYRAYCSDRVFPSINHIRRSLVMWKQAGIPKGTVQTMEKCFGQCQQTDPVCVNACECLNMQWIMDTSCNPGVKAPAAPNCQRWNAKCRGIWRPLPDFTPAKYSEMAPYPMVRGIFYGYEPLETYKTFNKPRDHGVSFWRGTNTVLVDWPEGKLSSATTYEVPFAGVNVAVPTYSIGFPSMRKELGKFTKQNPDPLNPGTGRRARRY